MRHLLTSDRLYYAWLAGGMTWLGWAISVALGPGNLDMAGQALGTDFVQYYAVGTTLAEGDMGRLYDLEHQFDVQKAAVGPGYSSVHAFVNPPFHALVYAPLSALPYAVAFAVWSALGVGLLAGSLRLAGVRDVLRKLPWWLCFFPVFATVTFGQNSFLSLFLLTLAGALWWSGRGFVAGLALALLLYKPQLVVGVGWLWVLGWRRDWPSLAGFTVGAGALLGGTWLLMPEAATAWVRLSRDVLPHLSEWGEPALWHMHTVRAAFEMLLPGAPGVAAALSLVVAVLAALAFVPLRAALRDRPRLQWAAAIVLTMLVTPHAMIYEWTLLVLPATLLWEELPERRADLVVAFAALWLVTFLAGPLAAAQLAVLPIAVQITVPTLILVAWRAGREALVRGPSIGAS